VFVLRDSARDSSRLVADADGDCDDDAVLESDGRTD